MRIANRLSGSIIILALLTIKWGYQFILKQYFYPKRYSEWIEKYSQEYEIDCNLIYAIVKAESSFKKNAKSAQGALGLMQIMPKTAQDVKEISGPIPNQSTDSLLEPENNIWIGIQYYLYLYHRYQNNQFVALAAYNAGPGNVDHWIGQGIIQADGSDIENIPFQETMMYVRKIINYQKTYQKLYQKGG